MERTLLIAAVLCLASPCLAGGPVAVADEPVVASTPAPGFDWTGAYAGISTTDGSFFNGETKFDIGGSGVQVGYLHDLGRWVVGAELSRSKGDFGEGVPADWTATRLKLIGGYDAGRVLPYVFVGRSSFDVDQLGESFEDKVATQGIGARVALGASGRIALGVEYLVQDTDDFADTTFPVEVKETALRLDYRF